MGKFREIAQNKISELGRVILPGINDTEAFLQIRTERFNSFTWKSNMQPLDKRLIDFVTSTDLVFMETADYYLNKLHVSQTRMHINGGKM